MEPSDEALILACRQGDAAAWETLTARYRTLIYTIARRAGLDAEEAAEVCQRVFTILVEHLDRLTQPALVRTWLVTTARREALHMCRRERALGVTTADNLDRVSTVADDAPLPDELMLRLEEQHLVRTALTSLDERCQRLLKMLFYNADPPPYAEVAETLKLPEGSIGPIRARCLQKLRRLLNRLRF